MTPRGLRWAVGGRPPRTQATAGGERSASHALQGTRVVGPRLVSAWPSELRTPPHHATSQAARSRTQLLRHPSPKRNTLTADLATRPPPAADTWRTTRPRARAEPASRGLRRCPSAHIPVHHPARSGHPTGERGGSGTRTCSAVMRPRPPRPGPRRPARTSGHRHHHGPAQPPPPPPGTLVLATYTLAP